MIPVEVVGIVVSLMICGVYWFGWRCGRDHERRMKAEQDETPPWLR